METDKSFDGYAQPRGKIITVFPLNDDEVLLYICLLYTSRCV